MNPPHPPSDPGRDPPWRFIRPASLINIERPPRRPRFTVLTALLTPSSSPVSHLQHRSRSSYQTQLFLKITMPAKRRCQFKTLVLLPASSPSSPTAATSGTPPPSATDKKEEPASASSVQCPNPAVRLIGTCPHCSYNFCSTHRLPEEHKCSHLQQCRDAAFEANRARLESERTVARKVAQT